MKLLDRYIGATILKSCLVVALILLSIFAFIELIQQLDDVDKGNFQTGDAFHYVLFSLPARLLDMAPIVALLGTVIGLGLLNRNSELIAMRASGISLRRIVLAVLKTATLLMLAALLMAQYLAPPAQQTAERERALAIARGGDILGEEGYWTRDKGRYLNIRQLRLGRIPADISLFEFDQQGALHRYLHAREAEMKTHRSWILKDVVIKRVTETEIATTRQAELEWQPPPAITDFGRFELPARSLALTSLYQYVAYLRAAGENTRRFEILFWQKVMGAVSIVALMLLAVPFAFGSLRSASFGLRLVLGVVAGLLYLLANQLLGNLALLVGLNAALAATAPVAAATVIALLLLRRVR